MFHRTLRSVDLIQQVLGRPQKDFKQGIYFKKSSWQLSGQPVVEKPILSIGVLQFTEDEV